MRILLVGTGPLRGGGVAYYERALSQEFTAHGHETTILAVDPIDLYSSRAYIRRIEAEPFSSRGIQVFDLVSNGVPYFSCVQPFRQCVNPSAESVYEDFLQAVGPDVVHFQAARPASMLSITRRHGITSIVSIHDYWFLCSQGFLIRGDNTLCDGPNDGLSCVMYCASVRKRTLGRITKDAGKQLLAQMPHRIAATIFGAYSDHVQRKQTARDERECIKFEDFLHPVPSVVHQYDLADLQAWRFRTEYMQRTLSLDADLIIAVSKFVREKLVQFGIPEDKIRTVHSGFEHAKGMFDNVSHRQVNPSEVVFGYVSPMFREKGLHVLIAAFEGLANQNARLLIRGKMSERNRKYWSYLKRHCSLLPLVDFEGEFEYAELPRILEQMDVLVVPSIMHDPSPRVVWEALASRTPVIASRSGGIPDFVQDGVNGLLFERANWDDLRDKMQMVLEDPTLVERLRSGIGPLKDITRHASELLSIYQQQINNAKRT